MIRLFGSVTSPYVRRVRIVADELAVPCELVDTATPEGTAALRALTPIWKVPAAEIEGQLVFDSHVICELLLHRYARGQKAEAIAPLAVDDLEARNAISVIDGALDALINGFYLAKEGVTPATTPYMKKQQDRAVACFTWLEANVRQPFVTSKRVYGLPEIALGSALGWMRFRKVYEIEKHPRVMRCFEELEQRSSFRSTQPA